MVVEITKETWGKCGNKTVKHYNKKEDIIELWQKVSDLETKVKHSNICDIALKRIKKYYGKKKQKTSWEKKNKNIKHILKTKQAFIIEKLAPYIIEPCKLPEAIELRKQLGYNHDNIMVSEETSMAEKIIKLFPQENIL